jgi:hypothetical protein
MVQYKEPKPFKLKNLIDNDEEECRRSMLDTSLYSNDNMEQLSDTFFSSNNVSPVRKCSEKALKANLSKNISKSYKRTLSFKKPALKAPKMMKKNS